MVHNRLVVDDQVIKLGTGNEEFFEEVLCNLLEGLQVIDKSEWHEFEREDP